MPTTYTDVSANCPTGLTLFRQTSLWPERDTGIRVLRNAKHETSARPFDFKA